MLGGARFPQVVVFGIAYLKYLAKKAARNYSWTVTV